MNARLPIYGCIYECIQSIYRLVRPRRREVSLLAAASLGLNCSLHKALFLPCVGAFPFAIRRAFLYTSLLGSVDTMHSKLIIAQMIAFRLLPQRLCRERRASYRHGLTSVA